jgi:hypothetical protein
MTMYLMAGILLLGSVAQAQETAIAQFARLQRVAQAAGDSGDLRGRLAAVRQMAALLNGAPDAVEATAEAYAAVGDSANALASLRQFGEMGQVDEAMVRGTDHHFAALHDLPEYKRLVARLAENAAPVSRGEMAFTVPDAGLLTEDIAYDPHTRTFLITSVLKKKIIRISGEGRATDFAQSPSGWPMLAIKVDTVRGRVWTTEVALAGFTVVPKADWGRSAVLCFDLETGALLRRIEGPAASALGDMVLTETGDPIVSDGNGGGVYRVVGDAIRLLNDRDFISPQTPAMVSDDDHVLVPDYARGVGLMDLRTGHVAWLDRGAGDRVALNGIDGLYVYRQSMILTQNGTSPERVARVALDRTYTRTVSTDIIEQGTPTLGDPTHGVIVGDTFFYIANSGWQALDEHGDVKPGARLTAPRIMRVRL